jgi:hypothetical protein
MRPDRAGASRCWSAPGRTGRGSGDIWRNEVGSEPYAVSVAAVPWNDGRLGRHQTFVSERRGASWQVVESERVARPMGTQD